MPSIGFASLQRPDPLAHPLVASPPRAAAGTRAAAGRAAGSSPAGPPSPRRSPRSRTAGCGSSRSSAARRSSSLDGHDHLAHDRQPLLGQEHVLGAAEADPLGAELARLGGVLGRVGVRAHLQPADLVRPAEDRLEVLVDLRRDERRPRRRSTRPVPPSIVITSPSRELVPADREPSRASRSIVQRLAAGDARLAHPARDDGRVRGHAAVRGEDALRLRSCRGCRPASSPSGRGSRSRPPCRAPRRVSASKTTLPEAAPGRGVQARRGDLELRVRVDHRVQQLVELRRVDARDRLLARDQPLLDHRRPPPSAPRPPSASPCASAAGRAGRPRP